jgi:hypothetical protein
MGNYDSMLYLRRYEHPKPILGCTRPRNVGRNPQRTDPATHSAKFPETWQKRTQNFRVINLPFKDEPKLTVASWSGDFLEDPTFDQVVEGIRPAFYATQWFVTEFTRTRNDVYLELSPYFPILFR